MGLLLSSDGAGITAQATTIKEVESQIKDTEGKIKDINSKIDQLSDEQDLILEKIDDLNAEILNTMTSIGMKEDEISEKESELLVKQIQIKKTETEYNEAVASEEKQKQDMRSYVRMVYSSKGESAISDFLSSQGLGGFLNRLDYIVRLSKYEQDCLNSLTELRIRVHDLWDRLEEEKTELEDERTQLEADRVRLQDQKAELDVMLGQKKKESANYEAEIKKAQLEAKVAKTLLKQEQQQLKALQLKAVQGENSPAASLTYKDSSYTETIDNAAGSDLGKKIAKYACQFIGNPYVMGGTSLTNGADCSGFVMRVYSDFNYKLPRTSTEQRSAGKAVDYADAQPGDLICYDGHVALYIGGGKIVHASNAKTGIKVSVATYRKILSVRRII